MERGQVREFPGDEGGDGDEVFDAAVAARTRAHLLVGSIHCLDTDVFACLERAAQVLYGGVGNRGGLAIMPIAGKLPERGFVSAQRGKQQTLCVDVTKNSDTRLAARTGGLIDAVNADTGMTFLGARPTQRIAYHAPQSATAHAQRSTRQELAKRSCGSCAASPQAGQA